MAGQRSPNLDEARLGHWDRDSLIQVAHAAPRSQRGPLSTDHNGETSWIAYSAARRARTGKTSVSDINASATIPQTEPSLRIPRVTHSSVHRIWKAVRSNSSIVDQSWASYLRNDNHRVSHNDRDPARKLCDSEIFRDRSQSRSFKIACLRPCVTASNS